jgi:hypothetical protein
MLAPGRPAQGASERTDPTPTPTPFNPKQTSNSSHPAAPPRPPSSIHSTRPSTAVTVSPAPQMSHLLSNVEFPEGRRPPPIVEGREADLWLPQRNEGSSFVYGALESRVAISRGKEVVETNPSSSKKHVRCASMTPCCNLLELCCFGLQISVAVAIWGP